MCVIPSWDHAPRQHSHSVPFQGLCSGASQAAAGMHLELPDSAYAAYAAAAAAAATAWQQRHHTCRQPWRSPHVRMDPLAETPPALWAEPGVKLAGKLPSSKWRAPAHLPAARPIPQNGHFCCARRAERPHPALPMPVPPPDTFHHCKAAGFSQIHRYTEIQHAHLITMPIWILVTKTR